MSTTPSVSTCASKDDSCCLGASNKCQDRCVKRMRFDDVSKCLDAELVSAILIAEEEDKISQILQMRYDASKEEEEFDAVMRAVAAVSLLET